VTHVAYAQCGPNKQDPCPPAPDKENKDKKAKPTATDVPTPTDTPTSEPPPVIIQTVVVTPDAKQLALMCAGLPGSPNGGTGPNAGNPEPNAPRILPFMDSLGGQIIGVLIGLLTGILIGLLLPAVLRGQRLSPGGIIAVNRDGSDVKMNYAKFQDGAVKLAPPPPGSVGNIGEGGVSHYGKQDDGVAKAVDYFDKPDPGFSRNTAAQGQKGTSVADVDAKVQDGGILGPSSTSAGDLMPKVEDGGIGGGGDPGLGGAGPQPEPPT
jgi:hypothetical protein